MISVDGLMIDARYAPHWIQEEAFRRGLDFCTNDVSGFRPRQPVGGRKSVRVLPQGGLAGIALVLGKAAV